MHGTIVVKDSVLAAHPWVARTLFRAFSRAKEEWLARLDSEAPQDASNRKYAALRKIVGEFEQGLTPRRVSIADLFVDPERN
jgi:4,5-dihydroxyphthalate decarboxylase